MSSQALTAPKNGADIVERVTIVGDLGQLTASERVDYYKRTCESLGLNPFTRPFDYIKLSGRLTLYAKRDAADQLRRIHGVSITGLERETADDLYVVTAHARTADGREDTDMGAVSVKGLGGENLANAMLKAVTKAKRRVTLSVCGLGWLDETEVENIPDARPVSVDAATGEIVQGTPAQPHNGNGNGNGNGTQAQQTDEQRRTKLNKAIHAGLKALGVDSRDRLFVRWIAGNYACKPPRPVDSLNDLTLEELGRYADGVSNAMPAEAAHWRTLFDADRAAQTPVPEPAAPDGDADEPDPFGDDD